MGSDVKKAYNADGRDELVLFNPEKLVLVTDKAHPLYDERVHLPLDEAMVRNIMVNGVIKPIVVRLNGKDTEGLPIVEVVDGRQRVKNAIEANKRLVAEGKEPIRVPAVRRRGDVSVLFGVMISTNEFNKKDGPLVKAQKLQRYLAMGRTEDEAAIQFGCTKQHIKNLLSLLELHPEVQKAIDENGLSSAIARELKNVPQEKQPEKLLELLKDGPVKGEAGVEKARNVARGQGAVSDRKRMMSRVGLQKWHSRLKKIDGKDAEVAYAVIARILGSERALANYPRLKAAFEEPAE